MMPSVSIFATTTSPGVKHSRPAGAGRMARGLAPSCLDQLHHVRRPPITPTPAASNAAIFSAAVPELPEMIAPA
jgi:hypothetical protein